MPTKVHLVKTMVFPLVMYGCESWTIKKAECQRIDAFELWCWRRLLRVPWTPRRSNQSSLKEISPGWFRSYLNGLVVFPTFFNLRLNLAIRSSWSEPQSAPGLVFADCKSFSIFGCKEYNQSDFGVDHLVMSMCRVFSCVVGRGCLLWPVHSLGRTLLAFTLLHSVLQGQICLLLQVFPDFLLLHSSPL